MSLIEFLGDLDLFIFMGGLVARIKAEIVLDLERDLSFCIGELGGEEDREGSVRVLGSSTIG
jgi:hypothetical protein